MTHRRIGIIGSGIVGKTLAGGFVKHGFEVMVGSRDTAKLGEWAAQAGVKTGSVEEAARFGGIVVLAVKGSAAEEALRRADPGALAGKTVIDTTNPIADTPPVHGVLGFFTSHDASLMERLQKAAPLARFVKAFSCVGNGLMVNPELSGGPPTMFICGNDAGAKAEVTEILGLFGWESEDLGAVEAARAIEPLCILWCIPGLVHNDWVHAFKLLRH
jgi:8-hydroxy-5-deazaflavin:NADPH oxidoreductase